MAELDTRRQAGEPLAVLLVHANPFQRAIPVPPYGLERVAAAAETAGAKVMIIDPFLFSEAPLEDAAAAARRVRPEVIGVGLRVVDDCITINRLDARADQPIDVSWFMPEIRDLCDRLRAAAPQSVLVAGGAAFSAFPQECLEYLGIEYGVVGAGESAFAELLRRWTQGRALEGAPGVVRRGEASSLERLTTAGLDAPTRREPVYSAAASFPVRTRSGCAMQCSYCLTANMLRRHANGDVERVLDEIESIVAEAAKRSFGRVPIFFADDEFNLPDEDHAIRLLQGLVERGVANRLQWRAYFNPTPLSAELADLVRSTNGQVSLTVDTASERVMERSQKPFRLRHLEAVIGLLAEHRVKTDIGLIFGLPGETQETIAETVAYVRRLPSEVRVVYSAGARVYPHTPLARIADAEPERLYGSQAPGYFAPVVYCSPIAPRELARQLAEEFAQLPNVAPVTLAYEDAPQILARAYRIAVGEDGDERWLALLQSEETHADPSLGSPQSALLTLAHVAEWHERFDLARLACRRLARYGELPPGLASWQLRLLDLRYRWRARAADRARRSGRDVV